MSRLTILPTARSLDPILANLARLNASLDEPLRHPPGRRSVKPVRGIVAWRAPGAVPAHPSHRVRAA